jgi:hypothetical protein
MTNGMISISPSSTSLTYVVIFKLQMHMVLIHLAADSVCKSLFDMFNIRSVFSSRQSTDKQVDVTEVSTVSFAGSFPKISRSLQWSYLPIQPFVGPHVVWYVPYLSLSRSWHTDLDYGSYHLPNLEIGLTAGVTGREVMFTPPRHLIPPMVYSEVLVRPLSDYIQDLWIWLLFVIYT